MATTEGLKNVPKADVPQIVADYLADGATKVDIRKQQSNGRWRITATFPE